MGFIPGLGRSPGEGNGNPLQWSYLDNLIDRGAWQATVHGAAESDTSEELSWAPTHTNGTNTILKVELWGLKGVMLFQYLLGCWAHSRHTVDTQQMPHLSFRSICNQPGTSQTGISAKLAQIPQTDVFWDTISIWSVCFHGCIAWLLFNFCQTNFWRKSEKKSQKIIFSQPFLLWACWQSVYPN